MSSPFSTLPDLCLLALFDVLPLSDLLHLEDTINTRWCPLLRFAIKNRHSLALLLNSPRFSPKKSFPEAKGHHQFLFDSTHCSLHLSSLSLEAATIVTTKLPQISHLEIIIDEALSVTSQLEPIQVLLTTWSPTLHTLTLCRSVWSPKTPAPLTPQETTSLYASLNSLTQLRRLFLRLSEQVTEPESPAPSLSILAHLTHFFFYNWVPNLKMLTRSLTTFGQQNTNWNALSLYYFAADLQSFLNLDTPQLCQNLIAFNIYLTSANLHQLQSFTSKYHNLHSIGLHLAVDLTLAEVVRALEPLRQLKYLHLQNISHLLGQGLEETTEELPKLSTVHRLILSSIPNDHETYSNINWRRFFPEIKEVLLRHRNRRCTLCGFHGDDSKIWLQTAARRNCDRALVKAGGFGDWSGVKIFVMGQKGWERLFI